MNKYLYILGLIAIGIVIGSYSTILLMDDNDEVENAEIANNEVGALNFARSIEDDLSDINENTISTNDNFDITLMQEKRAVCIFRCSEVREDCKNQCTFKPKKTTSPCTTKCENDFSTCDDECNTNYYEWIEGL